MTDKHSTTPTRFVEVNGDKAEGVFKKVPDRDEFGADINESLIVELYSR